MANLSRKALQKAAEELNEFLDITPKIKTTLSEDALAKKVKEAAGLLVVSDEENELLELTKTTQKVIAKLNEAPEEEEEPLLKKEEEEEEEQEELSLIEKVQEGTLPELKEIIKANKEKFPNAAKGIGLMKDAEKVREKALKDLDAAEEEEEEKPTPKKKAAKPTPPSEAGIVKGMDLDELKAHIKENKHVFPTAAKGINLAKDLDSLRTKALKDLGAEDDAKDEAKPTPKKKAGSMQSLADKLLSEEASEKEIIKAFTEAYAKKGKDDADFIEKRAAIYMNIAKKK